MDPLSGLRRPATARLDPRRRLLALAFYAKYAAVTLVAPLLLFAVADPQARRCWRTPGPYLAIVAFLAVLAPHLVWLVGSGFSPVAFAAGRAEKAEGALHLAYLTGDTIVSALSLSPPSPSCSRR